MPLSVHCEMYFPSFTVALPEVPRPSLHLPLLYNYTLKLFYFRSTAEEPQYIIQEANH